MFQVRNPPAPRSLGSCGVIAGIVIGVAIALMVVAMLVGLGVANRLAALPLGPVESRAFAQPFDGATVQFGAGQLTVGAATHVP